MRTRHSSRALKGSFRSWRQIKGATRIERRERGGRRRRDCKLNLLVRSLHHLLLNVSCSARDLEEKVGKPLLSHQKNTIIEKFEADCMKFSHSTCSVCQRVGLSVKLKKDSKCKQCCDKDDEYLFETNSAPTWIDDNLNIRYDVPIELAELTIAEKMLIQRASPFVPLQHVKHGVFGLCGHVCCFEQEAESLAHVLPRKRSDAVMLKVMKSIQAEIGSDAEVTKVFKVRREKVLSALRWLTQYNVLYDHIEIDESNLDWIDGEEGSLATDLEVGSTNVETCHDETLDINADLGPNRKDTAEKMRFSNEIQPHGFLEESERVELSQEDSIILDEIENSINNSEYKEDFQIDWPKVSDAPMDEYGSERIFALVFPWLFPGGVGDVKDFKGSFSDWGEMLLRYKDNRFAKDKFFCFYAMNYITRHRNAKQSHWFLKKFNNGGPTTLDDLKEAISNGDHKFINRITYANGRIKGSTSFWHQKRGELYSWINHHVAMGNGPPMYFITLSCAEHYWPDIIRLIKERMDIAGEDSSGCYVGSPTLSKHLNEYSLVVQEYFQARVELWLTTVGKNFSESSIIG